MGLAKLRVAKKSLALLLPSTLGLYTERGFDFFEHAYRFFFVIYAVHNACYYCLSRWYVGSIASRGIFNNNYFTTLFCYLLCCLELCELGATRDKKQNKRKQSTYIFKVRLFKLFKMQEHNNKYFPPPNPSDFFPDISAQKAVFTC